MLTYTPLVTGVHHPDLCGWASNRYRISHHCTQSTFTHRQRDFSTNAPHMGSRKSSASDTSPGGSMAWNRAVGPNHSLDIETSTTFNIQLIVGLHSIFRIRYLGWSFPLSGRYYIYYWDDSRIQKNIGFYAGNQTDWFILQSWSNRNGWSMQINFCVIYRFIYVYIIIDIYIYNHINSY